MTEYDEILEQADLDYVGTRLHAGIRALRKGRLHGTWKTEIRMPWEAIETWKGQFL